MIDYSLDSDEVILVECEDAYSDTNKERGNLVLTNKNFIWTPKTMFGKIKSIIKKSIKDIKVYNNTAEVRYEKGILQVYFKYEQFSYQIYDRSKAKEIVKNVNLILTGNDITITNKKAIPGTEALAGTIKSTIDIFKDTFRKTQIISLKCNSCGASLSGKKGETEKCPYCDSYNTFE